MKTPPSLPSLSFAVILGLTACSQNEQATTAESEAPAIDYTTLDDRAFAGEARAVTDQLGTNLVAQMEAAITTGGPAMAVEICQSVAQPLTAATNDDFPGLSVRRTALRVRNPQNTPDATDRAVLEMWDDQFPVGSDAEVPADHIAQTEAGTRRYYRPIVTQPVCLTCHGPDDSLDPDVKTLIKKHYPEDQATGFQAGELRGVFRIEATQP